MADLDSEPLDFTPYISAPRSSDIFAIFYTSVIEPSLISAFEDVDVDLFFTLTVLHVPTVEREILVSPLVVIFTTTDENVETIRAAVESVWTQNRFQRYLVCVSIGQPNESSRLEMPPLFDGYPTRTYHEHWKCGVSIGYGSKTATSGAIVVDDADEFAAVTCAHLFNERRQDARGLQVSQPSYEDFRHLYSASLAYRNHCRKVRDTTTNTASKAEWGTRYTAANDLVNQLDEVGHDTLEHYQSDTPIGTVLKSSYEVIEFRGRRCLRDYAILRLDGRYPDNGDVFYDPLPTKGYLAEIQWSAEADSVGNLQYDVQVKKRGAATGVTYGIVAGVHGVVKSAGEGAVRKEFWVLPEALSSSYEFADKGDSGALVGTKDGEAVGVVIAGWTAAFEGVRAVILPNLFWDTKNIPFPRDEEGRIDFKGLLSFAVTRPLVLIESFEMILEDIAESNYQLYVPSFIDL